MWPPRPPAQTLELWEMLDHLDLKRTPFAKRVFAIFDEDGSNQIDFREFVVALRRVEEPIEKGDAARKLHRRRRLRAASTHPLSASMHTFCCSCAAAWLRGWLAHLKHAVQAGDA